MEGEDAFDQKKITGRTDPAGPLFICGDHGRSGKPENPAGDHTGERPCAEAPAPDGKRAPHQSPEPDGPGRCMGHG